MADITLDHLTKVFDKTVVAVADLTIQIPTGCVVSLLGPSGCGKTTTMRMIAGLEKPTQGRILIDGKDVTHLQPKERDIAMVFQLPVNYDTLSAYDNLAFPLIAKKVGKKEIERQIEKTTELFEIPKAVLKERITNLGLSDRQRISLAHAFIIPRNLYLLDEPLSNLDPKGREDLRIKIKDVQMKIGQTILYVTHDQSEALTLADKIAIMRDGKLLQYSDTQEIFDHPQNDFVGWFLGNPGMNFIPCQYRKEKDNYILDAGVFQYRTDAIKFEAPMPAERRLRLGIRPEHVQISAEKKPGWIHSRCEVIEPIGNRLLLFQKIGEVEIVVKTSRNVPISEKADAWLNFPAHHVRLFDNDTGDAIA